MKIYTLVTAVLVGISTFSHCQELKEMGPLFGSGLHLDWRPIIENGVQQNTIVSTLSTNDWKYDAIYTQDKVLEISRTNLQNQVLEPLICFNQNQPVDYVQSPARIVDIKEGANTIAILLAVPQGYVYTKIINNTNTYGNDFVILPPAGVGKGLWRLTAMNFSPTGFGYHFPEISEGFLIQSVKLSSLTEVSLGVENEPNPILFNFSGGEILKNGVDPIANAGVPGKIHNPTITPLNETVQFIQSIDVPFTDEDKALHKERCEATEGGRAFHLVEMTTKLVNHPAELQKLQDLDAAAYPPE